MKEIIVSKEIANQRADKFVRKFLNLAPLSFIYKIFRKKDVKVNDHWIKENYILNEGDVLKIYVTDKQIEEMNKPQEISLSKINLDIIYEDENILVINKSKGILVQADEKEHKLNLTNLVRSYLKQKGEFINDGISYSPSPVHRLDRNTSGICIFAKKLNVAQELMKVFKDHDQIEKTYLALCFNKPKEIKGIINAPLLKNEDTKFVKVGSINNGAKNAISEYEVLSFNSDYSLLKVNILTGRTHQIRVHLAYINCPIVGDQKYGDFKKNKIFDGQFKYDNQFLHAYSLTFKNLSGEIKYLSNKTFNSILPKKESEILQKLNMNYNLNK